VPEAGALALALVALAATLVWPGRPPD